MANKQVLNEDILGLLFTLLDMSLYLPIPSRSKKLYKAAAKDYKSLHANFRSIFPDLKTSKQRQLHKKVMKDIDDMGKEFKNLLKQVNTDYDRDKKLDKQLDRDIKSGKRKLVAHKVDRKALIEAITVLDYLKEKVWASTDGKPLDFKYDPGKGKLTEISTKAGLEDVIKGRTTSIEGIKMSKDMAEAIMDWIKSSSFGRKYGKQILKGRIHALIKPANAWGIERFFKGRRASSSKLKQEWKNIVSKIKESTINEQVGSIWKDTKKYKIQRPPRNFAKKAKMGAMIHFTGHKSGAKGETWSKVYRDEWLCIYGEGVKGDTLSSKDLDKKLEKHARVQIKEARINEQSQFFGPDKVTPPKRKISHKILNVPIYDETPEEVDARRARIAQKSLEQDRITNLKDELGGSFGPFVKKDSWAHKINQAINVGELDPSREDWDDHATQWKSHVGDMEGGVDPTTYTLGKDSLEEGVPFPQTEPNEFAFFDFKKWAYKNRGKLKKELLKHKDNPGKLWNKLSDIWVEWAKKTNNKDFSRITDKQKFGRALALLLKKQNVLFVKNSSPSHKIVVKEQLDRMIIEEAIKIYKERKLNEQGILKLANFIKKTVKPLMDKFTGDKEEPEAIDIEKTEDRWYEPKPEPTDSIVDVMIKKEIKEQMTPSQTKFLSGKLKLKKGDKITYDQHFQFGKVSKNVTAKVVAVREYTVFLDKGPELDLRQDPIKKINGKAIK